MKILRIFFFAILSALPCFAQQVCTRALSGVNYVTTSPYPFVAADTTRLINFSSPTGITATLTSGITNPVFGACSEFTIWNAGLGDVVVNCAGCTINGSPSLRLQSLQSADLFGDGTNYAGPLGSLGDGQISYLNSPNGTTCNGLAKVDQTAGGAATVTAAGDELPILGVVRSGCGTSGNASIVTSGPIQVLFDAASATAGDAVGISTSMAGLATDLGSPAPTSTAVVIGMVILGPSFSLPSGCTNSPGCWVLLKPAGTGGGGGGGSPNAVVTNPSATQTITPTVSSATSIIGQCGSGAGSSQVCGQINDASGNSVVKAQNNDQAILGGGSTKGFKTQTSSNTDLAGELTASSNAASYTFTGTYSSHPICSGNDVTSRNAVQVTYTGTTAVTFTTSGATDVVDYLCIGRN